MVMSRGSLEIILREKLARLIKEAEADGVDVLGVLGIVPELAVAVGPNQTPGDIAAALMEADSLGGLIWEGATDKKSPQPVELREMIKDQTLMELVEDLDHEMNNLE